MLVQHMLQCVNQIFSSKLLVTLLIDLKICVMSEILCANGSDLKITISEEFAAFLISIIYMASNVR
jgi:hypothetical protein